MTRKIFIYISLFVSLSIFAQDKMYIYRENNHHLGALVEQIDSIGIEGETEYGFFKINNTVYEYHLSTIDSLIFGDNSDTISIQFNGTTATILNPLAFEGVTVERNGADITVTSTTDTKGIVYKLGGKTTNGMFKLYSEKSYSLVLNGVEITNNDGPAINIQSNKKANIIIADKSDRSHVVL